MDAKNAAETYARFSALCEKRGVTSYRVCKECGINTGTISGWRAGKYTPKSDKLQAIAEYFNVSLAYLETGENPEPGRYYLNDETAAIAQEIFENKEMRALFDAARDISPEEMRIVYDLALALKRREAGDSSDN